MASEIRQRHTFLVPLNDPNAPDNFEFAEGKVIVKDFTSPLHSRITVPFSLLPPRLHGLLRGRVFQISYANPKQFNRDTPFGLVQESGLRVDTDNDSWDGIQSVVEEVAGVLIDEANAVNTPNWKSYFTQSDSFKVDTSSPSEILKHFDPSQLQFADSVLVSYGVLPHTPNDVQRADDLVFEVYWSSRIQMQQSLGVSSVELSNEGKVEVGLLQSEDFDGEYRITGLIRNLRNKMFDKALFFTSPRRPLTPSSSTAHFDRPIGLHPHHKLEFHNLTPPQNDGCKLYAKYNIQASLFLDKYQLADLDRSIGSPATGKLIGVWGETDLEAPVWAVPGWGSEAMVEIYPADSFDLPMHSRYETPDINGTQYHGLMPSPHVFWACRDDENRPSQEFMGIGYESLFPSNTLFYRVDSTQSTSEFTIPVAPVESYAAVQLLTVSVIVGGFAWILTRIASNLFARKKQKAD